jgi:hypothetical protein
MAPIAPLVRAVPAVDIKAVGATAPTRLVPTLEAKVLKPKPPVTAPKPTESPISRNLLPVDTHI